MASEIIKEFGKKCQVWKHDSWFPSEVPKLTLVRNKLNLSLKYWFMEAKDVCRVCYCHKFWSKYQLNTIQTTFRENNKWKRAILVKINFFHAWKCIILEVFQRSEFWHPWRKPAIIFSSKMQVKRIKKFWTFHNFDYKIVTFFPGLYILKKISGK